MTRLLGLIALAACSGAGAYNGRAVDPPLNKPSVVWNRANGAPFDFRRETDGKVTLLFFGYTHCPDVCPMHLMHIASALRLLGTDTASMVRVIFVTIDPERDTDAVLTPWLGTFDSRYVALRGPMASVDSEIRRLRLAVPGTDSAKRTADPAHASAVIVFSRDNQAHFSYPETTNAEAWAYDIRKFLRDSVPR